MKEVRKVDEPLPKMSKTLAGYLLSSEKSLQLYSDIKRFQCELRLIQWYRTGTGDSVPAATLKSAPGQ